MLVAAAVLFYVSYWLISRFEAKRWTDFLAQRARRGTGAGGAGDARADGVSGRVSRRGRDLADVSGAAGQRGTDAAWAFWAWRPALCLGAVVLAVIAAVIRATSVRLPMQLFFKLSGLFLFVLAIVFAGNGVFELQNAGVLITTNLSWMGRGLPLGGALSQSSGPVGAGPAALRCHCRVARGAAIGAGKAGQCLRASSWRRSAGEPRRGGSQCRSGGSVRAWSP